MADHLKAGGAGTPRIYPRGRHPLRPLAVALYDLVGGKRPPRAGTDGAALDVPLTPAVRGAARKARTCTRATTT